MAGSPPSVTALCATITGRVHGVGFRYSTRRVATGLRLAGWVRNRPDGSVEVWAQGAPDGVAALLRFLHEGPPAAHVVSVTTVEVAPRPSLVRFDVTN